MKKTVLMSCLLLAIMCITGCSKGSEVSSQSRTDLTSEHINNLTQDMSRTDVENILGQDDDHLAQKEDVDVYSLSDGTTAILRYVDDKLAGVYIRGKDMYEDTIFSKFARDIKENLDEGEYRTDDGKVEGDTDHTDDTMNQQTGETGNSVETK